MKPVQVADLDKNFNSIRCLAYHINDTCEPMVVTLFEGSEPALIIFPYHEVWEVEDDEAGPVIKEIPVLKALKAS